MTETLARLQFAVAAVTHGLFASTTIGLIVVIALAQTIGLRRGDARLLGLARAWAAPYVAVYALGIVAGMLLEVQFGLNWSGLVDRAGNVVGAPFTIETLSTFVAESTLLALWTFGWDVLRPKWHLAAVWGIVLTALLSVFWSLVANGFLQHPRGYRVIDGTLVLTNFPALLTAPSVWIALLHVVGASLAVGAAVVAGVGAVRLRQQVRRGQPSDPVDVLAVRAGSAVVAIGAAVAVVAGGLSFWYLNDESPAKFETINGSGGGEVARELVARFGPGDWLPPPWIAGPAMIMMLLGLVILGIGVWGTGLLDEGRPVEKSMAMPWLPAAIVLPYLAVASGWVVREVGRQPWVVYGEVRASDATSGVSAPQIVATTVGVLVGCAVVTAAGVLLVRMLVSRWDVPILGTSVPVPPQRNSDSPTTSRDLADERARATGAAGRLAGVVSADRGPARRRGCQQPGS